MTGPRIQTDPDTGIPDLVSRLTADSKRLVNDEIRLAKLEVRESLRDGARGALYLGIAFGVGVVALAAFTVFLAAGIGRLLGFTYWAGAMIAGVIELIVAALLIKRGSSVLAEPGYTLPETRDALKETASWVGNGRSARA